MSAAPIQDSEFEFAVVGGGLAGSSAAITLAQAGRSVILIEADGFPREKLCGEFLSGESRGILHELGCSAELASHAPPSIPAMRFLSPAGRELLVPLPAPALGVSRRLLDPLLFHRAAALGAETRTRCRVTRMESVGGGVVLQTTTGQVRARRLIAAWGRRSVLDPLLTTPAEPGSGPIAGSTPVRPTHLGLKRHHRIADTEWGREMTHALDGGGELFLFRGGYCGISRVEAGWISVCALLRQDLVSGAGPLSDWSAVAALLSAAHPTLARRLSGLTPADDRPMLATAIWGFSARPKQAWNGQVLLVGDAGGMIAPLCGDGQAMALDSGRRLAQLLIQQPPSQDPAQLARLWESDWNRFYNRRMELGRRLQNLALHPFPAEWLIRLLNLTPPLTRYLARQTRGTANPAPG